MSSSQIRNHMVTYHEKGKHIQAAYSLVVVISIVITFKRAVSYRTSSYLVK